MSYLNLLVFMLYVSSLSAAPLDSVLTSIVPGTITLIGETHQHQESIRLFRSVINEHLKRGDCLTVALEIPSDQQDTIEQIGQGGATAADIDIAPAIDHQAYRDMLDGLAALRNAGACLNLVAIDGGVGSDVRRDEWMAMQLEKRAGETPILALLGNLHTLKRVNWDPAMVEYSPYAAEILASEGENVRSYSQLWAGDCASQARFIEPDSPEALGLLNQHLISLLNAFDYQTARGVADGIIAWECDKRPRGN